MDNTINHVTVIGAGTMGSQIAMVAALAGITTTLTDISQDALDRAREQLHARMERKGTVDALENLTFTTDRDSAVAHTDIVVEAAIEDIDIKRTLFAELDAIAPPHTILVTNSSNIVSSRIADATTRADKVCNMHFFNPALVMECVEIVCHPGTSEATRATVTELAERMGKKPIQVRKEIPGFVANRLLNALRKEALELYSDGVASFEDIDAAATTALRHPMGPFQLMDLVGIDVVYLIRQAEYEQTGDAASLPHPEITKLYQAGRYGRKTSHGWYAYEG
ncbi:3-hydroxyacyl-CoA dehydrogenase family protein [Corynebacterium argentoratense]|uniref:3-hydroxyacyl-CoA dehydrogenase family protein n=1 Tax=Corynebacterium argentoratense TaxID=42817 RepID=UPI001F2F3488|nr:3-hydroxyacyl-CoA dehydrogenase family protein [Corynebacterium argentoratense]MCF1711243.1 3-hydroxyacyl-CoA dehydrogenase family protein [Corynebacterium argentoratense]